MPRSVSRGERTWKSVSKTKGKTDPKGTAKPENFQNFHPNKTHDHSSDSDYYIPKKVHKQPPTTSSTPTMPNQTTPKSQTTSETLTLTDTIKLYLL